MARFKRHAAAQKALANTVKLASVKAVDYDTVFYPGCHSPMWDVAESPDSIALIEFFYIQASLSPFICHGPGVLHKIRIQV